MRPMVYLYLLIFMAVKLKSISRDMIFKAITLEVTEHVGIANY